MNTETQENRTAENNLSTDSANYSSEWEQPCWSVVTYETVAVSNLTYNEALSWIEKLKSQKVSGLCIVTNAAATRTQHSE
jgi:hypothetical protein